MFRFLAVRKTARANVQQKMSSSGHLVSITMSTIRNFYGASHVSLGSLFQFLISSKARHTQAASMCHSAEDGRP